jgi:hypothetical protein
VTSIARELAGFVWAVGQLQQATASGLTSVGVAGRSWRTA